MKSLGRGRTDPSKCEMHGLKVELHAECGSWAAGLNAFCGNGAGWPSKSPAGGRHSAGRNRRSDEAAVCRRVIIAAGRSRRARRRLRRSAGRTAWEVSREHILADRPVSRAGRQRETAGWTRAAPPAATCNCDSVAVGRRVVRRHETRATGSPGRPVSHRRQRGAKTDMDVALFALNQLGGHMSFGAEF